MRYTSRQRRIVGLATGYLNRLCPGGAVIPMFRSENQNISAGLAYTEGDQNYIVREKIYWYATSEHILFVCERMVRTLARTYARSAPPDGRPGVRSELRLPGSDLRGA